jgi:phosphatidylglycerophosphatase A
LEPRVSVTRGLALALATAGGVGFAPFASGTFGALVGVLLFLPFSHFGVPLYCLTLAALTCLGIWVSDIAERAFGRSDDGRIVIDEVAGQLLALLPLVVWSGCWPGAAGSPLGIGEPRWWGLVVTAFVLFRVFDIWKPGPVGWVERRLAGGVGVMADDMAAGALGAAVLSVGLWLFLVATGSTW